MNAKSIYVSTLLTIMSSYNGDGLMPFIDETGIPGLIDINISAAMTDIEDLRKALEKQGLILQKGEVKRKVLVIRDPQPGKDLTTY